MLAKRFQICDRPERASDQALDFERPPTLLSARRLAVRACVGGAWQHAIFGGDPAAARVAKERGDPVLDRSGAQYMRVTEFREA